MFQSALALKLKAAASSMKKGRVEELRDKFLGRKLNDFNFVKKLSDVDLREKIGPHIFHTKPYLHQLACLWLGITNSCFLFLLEMGLGKTWIMLNIINWRMKHNQIKRTLVLVPNVVNVATWVDEVKKHAPNLRCVRLDVTSRAERQRRLDASGDIWIVNYAGLQSLMAQKATKGGRVADMALVDKMCNLFDCIVMDESHKVGNTKTFTFRMCNELSKRCTYRYALTGTPFGRDPLLLWGQYYLVDRGATLGFRLTLFRDIFFRADNTPWGRKYIFRKRMKDDLNRVLQNSAILYKTDECLTLPKLVPIRIPLDPPKDMLAHYNAALEEARNIRAGSYTVMQNIFMRMRQIASGFIRLKDEDEEKIDISFGFNPKLEALKELVEELPEGCKMVVFHDFLYTGKMISEALTKMKVKHVRLYGGTPDKEAVIHEFQQNPECTVMIANSVSGGTGTNFQIANYVVFFESPVSPITRVQAERRCYRTGQDKPVYMYDLVMTGTMDERILGYIIEGKDLFRAICEKGVDNV